MLVMMWCVSNLRYILVLIVVIPFSYFMNLAFSNDV